MRRSVEGSDDIDNNFSQVYIKNIKKSIWFSEFTIYKIIILFNHKYKKKLPPKSFLYLGT